MTARGPGGVDQTSAAALGSRVLSLLVRPTAPPMWLGLLVAAAAISAETLLVVVLRSLAPMDTFGVVYLLGALVVAIGWGTGLAAVTSVVSALGFGYFRELAERRLRSDRPAQLGGDRRVPASSR